MSASFFERNIYKIINLDYSMTKREVEKDRNAFGVTSFTLGILCIVFIILNPIIAVIIGIIGFIFGKKQNKIQKTSLSKAGIILNIIGIILSIAIIILGVIAIRYITNNPEILTQLQQGGYNVAG